MQRICFLLKVKQDRLDEYRRAHDNVWPEMHEALSKHGWHNYSLFLQDDGLLVGYVETPDFEVALDGMQCEEVNAKWQETMKGLFENLGGETADTSLTVLDQVFYHA